MPPVFGHGRLRLYLLKLLNESPRHGYEVIRLLEERFHGMYSPSAGTVYPRLAKLASEGLVRHTVEGGRKVYSLTEAGERELAARESELAELEAEVRESLAALAADVRRDVGGSAHDLREELHRAAASASAPSAGGRGPGRGPGTGGGAPDAAEAAARAAGRHFEEAARRIQERTRRHSSANDWQAVIREGMEGLGRELDGWQEFLTTDRPASGTRDGGDRPTSGEQQPAAEAEPTADWEKVGGRESTGDRATSGPERPSAEPLRDLERLLDAFRDEVRDAARDGGVTEDQLRLARRRLSTTSAHLVALLNDADEYRRRTGED
ncbi:MULTISPECIES: PadR family transcriptional regulator [Streptomyces]|uniref:PadR family transcriptional regulator n=2 Tax=Streptomyces TaxID=1883 RepID=UPI000CD50DA8|nr:MULTISPECIES: PadR family transcriptional regulator [Streptomyces]